MSNSPLRDWFGRVLAPVQAAAVILEEHHVARAPGQFGNAPVDGSRTFQSVSATQENNLLVTMFSAFDAVITLTGLIHRPNNEFTPIGPGGKGFQLSVKGDYAIYQQTLTLGSSIGVANLNLVISSAGANVPVNACWAIVQTIRPLPDGTSATTSTLLSGPVTLLQPLAYPGSPVQKTADSTGYHRVISVPTPAAGQEITVQVPQGAKWQINTLQFTLTTSATAGNREILLRYTSGVTVSPQTEFTVEAQGTLQGASMACQYAYGATLSPLVSTNFGTGASSTTRQQGLPGNRFLLSAESITTQTAGIAAGDQYSAIVLGVVEVLDPTAPPGSVQAVMSWTGAASGSQNLALNGTVKFSTPGTYVITVNTNVTMKAFGVAGGGGGAGVGTNGFGAGGGGGSGAWNNIGVSVTLLFGVAYELIVGAGGVGTFNASTAGGSTSFKTNDHVTTYLLLTGGGPGVLGGAGGANGAATTGAGGVNGATGGAAPGGGGGNSGPGGPAAGGAGGAADGGIPGAGGTSGGGAAAGGGPSGGPGGGHTGGAGGGGGTGANPTWATGSFGGGGGGAGENWDGATRNGGAGQQGVAALVLS